MNLEGEDIITLEGEDECVFEAGDDEEIVVVCDGDDDTTSLAGSSGKLDWRNRPASVASLLFKAECLACTGELNDSADEEDARRSGAERLELAKEDESEVGWDEDTRANWVADDRNTEFNEEMGNWDCGTITEEAEGILYTTEEVGDEDICRYVEVWFWLGVNVVVVYEEFIGDRWDGKIKELDLEVGRE